MYTIKDAVETKRYWDGKEFRTLYKFKCKRCGLDLWKRGNVVPKMVGLCRRCAATRPNIKSRKRPHEWRFNRLLLGAEKRHIPVTLSYEEYVLFTTVSECHYCGSTVDWMPYRKFGSGTRVGSNLDRKDNSTGYIKENLVVACKMCNRIKNNHLSYEEMLRLSPVLREIIAERQRGAIS
jgi:5-methylcytosine-specific restriction endonuclease McrA